MKKRAPVEYVNNKEFYEAILVYRAKVKEAEERGLEPPRLPNYIGACIQKIAEKLSLKPCFMNYSFRDEMISDGIENCLLYFHDYNPEITQNPFAYFTQIVYYAFLRRITKEEKNRYAITWYTLSRAESCSTRTSRSRPAWIARKVARSMRV